MSKSADQQSYLSTLNTGHPGVVTSPSHAGIELHVDKLSPTSSYATTAGQPTYKFDVTAQSDDLVNHSVTISKTANAHKGLAQSYQQISVIAAEFDDLQPKP